jgi:hypothetical protein
MSSYPQSIAVLTEMVSNEPIQVHQEAEALPKPEERLQITEKSKIEAKPMLAAEAPKPTIAKMKKPSIVDGDSGKATVAK